MSLPTDNVNRCFCAEENFFIIDSENLENVETRIFGFCIQDRAISGADTEQGAAMEQPGRCGAYTAIRRSEDQITVTQDYLGSYGLYLYRAGDKFVISNSFYYLVEHLKGRKLTINMDYVNAMRVVDLCSMFLAETMVNEIEMLPPNVVLHIDIPKKSLRIESLEQKEGTVEMDSQAGAQILDRWFERWTVFLRNLQMHTDNIQVALSGGFDSRVTFMLALCSGMDMDRVRVFSIQDNLHTHEEDFEIASGIAEHFHIRLNSHSLKGDPVNGTGKDVFDMVLYGKLPFHKEMYFKYRKNRNKYFLVSGSGGEMFRSYWDMSEKDLVKEYTDMVKAFPRKVRKELYRSVTAIFSRTFERLSAGDYCKDLSHALYRQARCRNHFGRAIVEDSWIGQYQITPWIDPELSMLKRSTDAVSDPNLLYTFILARYCPDLLSFPFEGEREIAPETIQYALDLNKKFPRTEKSITEPFEREWLFRMQDRRLSPADGRDTVITNQQMTRALKRTFEHPVFRQALSENIDDAFIKPAIKYYYEREFHPLRRYFPLLAETLVRNVINEKDLYSWFIDRLSLELGDAEKEESGDSPFMTRQEKRIIQKVRIKKRIKGSVRWAFHIAKEGISKCVHR